MRFLILVVCVALSGCPGGGNGNGGYAEPPETPPADEGGHAHPASALHKQPGFSPPRHPPVALLAAPAAAPAVESL